MSHTPIASSESVDDDFDALAARALRLDIERVSHAFEIKGQTFRVLDDVSLHVDAGEFVALLGPSGSGKSTLLRLAAGLDVPRSGQILEDGLRVTGPGPSRLLVFQEATLFPWLTVWQNVAAGLDARGLLPAQTSRVDDILRLVKLDSFAQAYPHQLSGGMAQRAAIARALVNHPRLLLLDEPFGKLDSLTRLNMQNELLGLWRSQGFTALLVTHDVEEALLLADRVIVFSDRPARIVSEIVVDKLHPRRRDDADLVELRRQLLETLGVSHDV
ncbi:ABC transporter ATP-binding protein [Pararobbsia silviterrae]|uniref:ABC transporter ATP-binding protein n=1 Tax=Pararobbsia silviterrae TaxID=1792498 RepID=A0A494XV70_9BURK|nr:ABC transporter ATP-binding protein [Pararobbsia silviterrae]RKP53613.1 ABC transporter ATP-binding protein [Pararobbsia silviterrae]